PSPDSTQDSFFHATDVEPPAASLPPEEENVADDTSWLKYLATSEQEQEQPAQSSAAAAQEKDAGTTTAEALPEEDASAEKEDEAPPPWMKYIYGDTNIATDTDIASDALATPGENLAAEAPTEEPADNHAEDTREDRWDAPLSGDADEMNLTVEDETGSDAFPAEEASWSTPAEAGSAGDTDDALQAWFDEDGATDTAGADENQNGQELFTALDEPATEPPDDEAVHDYALEAAVREQAPYPDLFAEDEASPLSATPGEESSRADETVPWEDFAGEDAVSPQPASHLELFSEDDESPVAEPPADEWEQAYEEWFWDKLEDDEGIAEAHTHQPGLFTAPAELSAEEEAAEAPPWSDRDGEETTQGHTPHLELFAEHAEAPVAENPTEETESWAGGDDDAAQQQEANLDLFADEPQILYMDADETAGEDGLRPVDAPAGFTEPHGELFDWNEEMPRSEAAKETAESRADSRVDTRDTPPDTAPEPHAEPSSDTPAEPPPAPVTTAAPPSQTGATAKRAKTRGADSPAVKSSAPAHAAGAKTDETASRAGYRLPPQLSQAASHGSRATLGWGLGILLLSAALGLQYLYYQRTELAQSATWRPLLERMCSITGCELPLRRDLQRIQLVDHMMQNHPRYQKSLLITATLVNRAEFSQPFPVVEVLMTDLQQQVVARRRFRPDQYLVGGGAQRQFVPNTEVPLMLEVLDPGESAVGFEFRFY
ncbi:MAG TPA: DUF3426 domain-containing protein, partial [Gammaproteobacteria bacterium]